LLVTVLASQRRLVFSGSLAVLPFNLGTFESCSFYVNCNAHFDLLLLFEFPFCLTSWGLLAICITFSGHFIVGILNSAYYSSCNEPHIIENQVQTREILSRINTDSAGLASFINSHANCYATGSVNRQIKLSINSLT